MPPKTIIVDKNDKIIGLKERELITKEDIYRVSALWIENSKGEVLLAQRAFTKKHSPGKWGPAVAGTVEEGETYESNLIKEAGEEIGLFDFNFKIEGKISWHDNKNYFTQFFSTIVDKKTTDFKIQEKEVVQVKWFKKAELAKLVLDKPEDFVKSMPVIIGMFIK